MSLPIFRSGFWVVLTLLTRRSSRGKVWGSDEVNVEGWKPLKRLPGHESGSFYSHSANILFNLFITRRY